MVEEAIATYVLDPTPQNMLEVQVQTMLFITHFVADIDRTISIIDYDQLISSIYRDTWENKDLQKAMMTAHDWALRALRRGNDIVLQTC